MERPGGSSSWRRLAPLLRWSTGSAMVAVSAFHLEILLARLSDATLARPEVAWRWLASAALVAAGLELRRRGALLRGHAGLLLAVAVLLLHLGAPAAPPTDGATGLLVALPAGLTLGIAAAKAVTSGGLLPAPLRQIDFPTAGDGADRSPLGSLASRFVPRPPPLAAAAS